MLSQNDMFTAGEVDIALELVDTFLNNSEQKDYLFGIAQDEAGRVVGYVCYGPTPLTEGTFDLYWIAVHPQFQRQGIGLKLLYYCEAEVLKKGGRLVIIETSSRPAYTVTRDFYLNNGYTIAAQIRDFYRPGDDRVIYTRYFNTPHN